MSLGKEHGGVFDGLLACRRKCDETMIIVLIMDLAACHPLLVAEKELAAGVDSVEYMFLSNAGTNSCHVRSPRFYLVFIDWNVISQSSCTYNNNVINLVSLGMF
jgi:hypothetical protein